MVGEGQDVVGAHLLNGADYLAALKAHADEVFDDVVVDNVLRLLLLLVRRTKGVELKSIGSRSRTSRGSASLLAHAGADRLADVVVLLLEQEAQKLKHGAKDSGPAWRQG